MEAVLLADTGCAFGHPRVLAASHLQWHKVVSAALDPLEQRQL
jgi:hypothetical protein